MKTLQQIATVVGLLVMIQIVGLTLAGYAIWN